MDELYEIAETIPDVERHDVLAYNEDVDEYQGVPWRDSLWTVEEDPSLAGEVSASGDYYNVIQYGDILEEVGKAIEQRPESLEPEGRVTVSPTAHKMSGRIGLGESIEPIPGDVIDVDLRTRSGHSGYHGVKYDVGGIRQVCSNGAVGFVADQSYEQTHGEPFQPQLAHYAVDAVVEGTEKVEERLAEARERTLMNQDEALLVLKDIGIDRFLDNPTPDLINALHEEVEDPDEPSLYETFNAATYALTHLAEDDVPEYALDDAYDRASQLLEYGDGIPSARILGENAVRHRADELIEDPDAEEYWEGETESVRELMEAHEIQA